MSGAIQFVEAHLDFSSGAELRSARFEARGFPPSAPTVGQLYWSVPDDGLVFWTGSSWERLLGVSDYGNLDQVVVVEHDRAVAAETSLLASINALALEVAGQADYLTGLISTEVSNRESAVAALAATFANDLASVASAISVLNSTTVSDTDLSLAVSALETAIASEVAARSYADVAEQAARAAGDNDLADEVQVLYNTTNSLTTADSEHDSRLTGTEGRLDVIETTFATRAELDAAIQALDIAESVRVIVRNAGSTVTTSGEQTFDGVAVVSGDRVLVAGTATQDGIWIVSTGTWAQTPDVLDNGTFVFVEAGTQYGSTGWVKTDAGWTQFSGAGGYSAGGGLTLAGTVFSVDPGVGLLIASSGELEADVDVLARHFSQTIGDGVGTSFSVSHNFGTQDVVVSVRNTATNAQVVAAVSSPTVDAVTVEFVSPPTLGQYRVTVTG